MEKWRKDKVEEIMSHLDFFRIHRTMIALDWKWALIREGKYVNDIPSLEEIKTTARECLERGHSTGGFWLREKAEKKSLEFFFAVESYTW